MTDRKTELIREEDERWAEVCALLGQLSAEQMQRPGYSETWSVKDLLGHLGAWWAETSHALERMRMGTYERRDLDIDALNDQFFEACKDVDLDTIRAELFASRNRALEELSRLPDLTADAERWFVESGTAHYAEHLPELRRFVESSP